MTLIVAGYESTRSLFFAADSTISNDRVTLLGDFQKVYEIPVLVSKPRFRGEQFYGYDAGRQVSACAVAFAGNTLTAQHVLNIITRHLRHLMIGQDSVGRYAILRYDEYNELLQPDRPQMWAEDTFTPEDMRDLLTGNKILNVVQHAIQSAVSSARKYKLDEASFRSLRNEYAVGVHCPVSNTVTLALVQMDIAPDPDGILQARATLTQVNNESVLVLGMRNRFKLPGLATYAAARTAREPVSKVMFSFIKDCIHQVQAEGSFEIDLPAYMYQFSSSGLSLSGIASATGKSAA